MKTSIIVTFGRPGAGKTTIAAKAVEIMMALRTTRNADEDVMMVEQLDLDVCVPDWMRDNFAKSIYPTLAQRLEFAQECCKRVETELLKIEKQRNKKEQQASAALIVSFSFVNADLRDVFRKRFPESKWVLIETSEEEAQRRLEQRQGHFYRGKQQQVASISTGTSTTAHPPENSSTRTQEKTTTNVPSAPADDKNNSDWNFAPVTFPHTVLDGSSNNSIETNAAELVRIIVQEQQQGLHGAADVMKNHTMMTMKTKSSTINK